MDDTTTSDVSLPKDADPTGAVGDVDTTQDTVSAEEPFTVSVLSEKTRAQTEPISPGRNRKRHSDEVYQKADRPVTTTPQKTPPRRHFSRGQSIDLPASVVFGSQASFESRPRPSNLQNVMNLHSSPNHTLPPSNQQSEHGPNMAPSQPRAFVDELRTYQKELDNEFEEFSQSLKQRDRQADLEEFDWDELEGRYRDQVKPLLDEEDRIKRELGHRLQQFLLWMQVSGEKESERAIKRLRTRTAFVKNSEARLEQQQQHYSKVLGAFQTALNLLNT